MDKAHQLLVHVAHDIGCHLLTAKLCDTLAKWGDERSIRVAQVGIKLLLVMGRKVDPATAQPETKIALTIIQFYNSLSYLSACCSAADMSLRPNPLPLSWGSTNTADKENHE